ncbi:TPA: tetratricopeptide repeat protein, partial [Candidatus Poribacteria bacterium]|nr:tetratricopeptide repeat protein [Candidatus Poribacteria bacterium]
KAINCYQKAIQINPNLAEIHNNLGSLYQELGKTQEAMNCYQKAIQINPNLSEVHNNLGNLYRELGEYQKAINCYQKAIQINPNLAEARNNLGSLYRELGKTQEAMNCYQKAIDLYDHVLALNPNNSGAYSNRETALHLLNSQAGVTTKTASEDYIKTLFDDYAKRFDHHLTTILDYKVPQFLINSLYTLIGSDLIFDNVIDLGCGTGLSGKEFRPISKRLVGIDLSPKMIEIAEGKKIYDLIENIEVNKYLETKSEKYDLFIATDFLIYVGDPTRLFSNISKTSKPKAIFLFSTESTQDKDYVLTNQGRYAHSEEYIHQLAKLNKFTILNVENATIRKGIEGHLFILRYLG